MIALLERLKRQHQIDDYEVMTPGPANERDRMILWVPVTVTVSDMDVVMHAIAERALVKGETWETVVAVKLERQTVEGTAHAGSARRVSGSVRIPRAAFPES